MMMNLKMIVLMMTVMTIDSRELKRRLYDDGSESVVNKVNLRRFKLYRVYLDRLICQMQAIFP